MGYFSEIEGNLTPARNQWSNPCQNSNSSKTVCSSLQSFKKDLINSNEEKVETTRFHIPPQSVVGHNQAFMHVIVTCKY